MLSQGAALPTKNISSFQDRLSNSDWNNIMSCSQCQQGYSMFHKKYIEMYNQIMIVFLLKILSRTEIPKP